MSLIIFCILATMHSYVLAANTILNASYDPTREFYDSYNKLFVNYWKKKTGQDIFIQQSHGGSGAQARAVIDGLKADVITLALSYDIDLIAQKTGLLPSNWQTFLPYNSSPYTSTIIFLVRKGNPKRIKDWEDLIRSDVKVITANPKTSGGARWNYMAAWGYALNKNKGNEAAAKQFITLLYKNVPVLDTAARGATNTFIQRGIGDVLVTWENEAYLALAKIRNAQFQIIVPSISILTEPPVALLEQNAQAKGNTAIAKAYLEYLYSPIGQEMIAKWYFRPRDSQIAAKYRQNLPQIKLFTIGDFGGWQTVQKKHFDDGGIFDQIYHGNE